MNRPTVPLALILMLTSIVATALESQVFAQRTLDPPSRLTMLQQQFFDYSGATLVFAREGLPEGQYHDVLKPLVEKEKVTAAQICIDVVDFTRHGKRF